MTKVDDESLRFEDLLVEAVLRWSGPLQPEITYIRSLDGKTRYSVNGLIEEEERISSIYDGSPMEILMRNLHHAIAIRLHAVAPEFRELVANKLNRTALKATFDALLLEAKRSRGLGWTAMERSLIDRYFAANAVSSSAA